jgi:predicted RNA-binding protein YlxR (DUF448 family)
LLNQTEAFLPSNRVKFFLLLFFQKKKKPLPQRCTTEDEDPETGPQRRCIITRDHAAREKMLRFVVGPDRAIVPDLAARLPGRGLWLSARRDVVEAARSKGGFAKAARGAVSVPADLTSVLQAGLARRIADHLGLARRAGQAVAGFEKARALLQSGQASLVIEASDGSEDERRRLLSGARAVTVAWPLDGATLGSVFGRDRAVHVAVMRGKLADRLANEIERLAGVSGQVMVKQAGE